MISVVEAKKILSENIRVLPDEKVSVVESSGRRLSKDIITPMDVPSFNNSAMDGYAFCYEPGKTDYRVSARIQAGDPAAYTLQKDEAARIFTGAP
ncbi:MAG: molybdopterin molybdenumtransferase MoeA, partial [Chitinophagaceae bacterium]|nr:molybdopterin molybdenumtransferase MoeA [Chitinophagaceae bacterium]